MRWTKQNLAESLNQRIDKGIIPEAGALILPLDITDSALEHFQFEWDRIGDFNAVEREKEFLRLYQALSQES